MTPDERAALVERVAEELWQADSIRVTGCRRSVPWSEAGPAAHNQWRPLAAAAVSLIRAEVLEEAARVCDEHAARYEADIPDGDSNDGLAETVAASLRGRAAAIRALKEKDNDV